MSLVVENENGGLPQLGMNKFVRASRPENKLPPPEKWTPNEMRDDQFPIVECKNPTWEVANILWELERSESLIEDATTYLDCALKATEVLRYQWSRRFMYYFLHCGKFMRLLRFNRAGLVASGKVDIISEPQKFLSCLLSVFSNQASKLGYPYTKEVPRHLKAQRKTHHVIEIDRRLFCLDQQIAGPSKNHLVSRGTVC